MTNIPSSNQNQPKGRYFGYIRVSTPKQGEGVSLLTQREEIARFAARRGLLIVGWFEEKETAAKRGRPIFGQVLRRLRNGEADGLIVYKVDRSVRNLKDWADLGELIDSGIPVYFAGEGIDMNTRSGRLAADIEAVVAADYIRNLRDEAKRGIRKRLEQGFYPNRAPVGYLDRGAGKPKEIDPERGPLIRLAFTWYATGEYTLRKLSALLYDMGLRNRRGGRITFGALSFLLHNPFYMGQIRLRKQEGQWYSGVHQPIVAKDLFFAVQQRLKAQVAPRRLKHHFKYSRMLKCSTCGRSLVGSLAKGRVYYRCHTITCPTTSIREEVVDTVLRLSKGAPAGTVAGKSITPVHDTVSRNPTGSAIRLNLNE
jgi:DNA invertase Pin-like site-specific DNA recombinase